ncbi:hypothetical protein [Streptomyces umbrinus]|uniref:hypothetical protein n=1 Tax=Streptomyces umbrinus TaxID=67370 RepID=UPI0033EC6C82
MRRSPAAQVEQGPNRATPASTPRGGTRPFASHTTASASGTAIAALLIGAAPVTASGSESETAPPPAPPTPEWGNADGTIDEGRMPETMPLIGSDGKVAEDANGRALRVKTRGLLNPSGAPVTPKPKAGENRSTETDVDERVPENIQVGPSVPPAG